MQMLSICIDIDGTVTEPNYWLPRANEYFNMNIQSEDVNIYDIHKLLGIEEEDYNRFYNAFGELLHKEATIRFGAKEIINKLYTQHQINFVTAREEKMRDISLEWLAMHQISMDSISLLGSNNKVNQAKKLVCDIFIEDRYENAIQLAQAGFDVLLIDCNYNKGRLPSNVIRVKNWFHIEKIIINFEQRYNRFKLA